MTLQPDQIIEAAVLKRGETVTRVRFQRSPVGLKITCWAHPAVEDLMRSWGTGEIQAVTAHGRNWEPLRDPLKGVYHLGTNPGVCPYDGGHYRLDRVGQPLIDPDGCVNLSFVRLIGVSEGEGVSFSLKGVHTLEAIRDMGERIKLASRRLYINYMKPVDLTVTVSTQEIR